MHQELEVVFDGNALQLETPLNIATGTRLRIIVESVLVNEQQSTFIQTTKFLRPIGLCAGEFVVPDDKALNSLVARIMSRYKLMRRYTQ